MARHRDVLGAAVAALLAAVVGALSLRVWQWRPGIPLSVVGDSPVVLTQLDDIVVNGWFWSNQAIGFPLGQDASFFPELDVIHVLGVKALAVFGGSGATVGAFYFFLGFPLVAVTTYLLSRSEHLTRTASVVVAVLFAVAPYHQERFEHLWLASYWTVPIALWLVLAVARGTTPFDPGARPSRADWVLTLLGLALVGLSGAYYAGFTLLLVLAALVLRAGTGRAAGWWRGGLASMAVLGAVAAVPLLVARVGMAGTPLTGPRPATRSPLESERYAGRLIDLALPWEGHRVDALASLTQTYQAAGRPVVETVALGVVGLVGVTALLLIGLRRLATGRMTPPRLTLWAALLVVAGLFYTAGGLGSVVALVATPQLRTWSRLSLVILLLGLLAVGHWLSRPRRRAVALALATAVLVVGALDQTNPGRAPDYAGIQQRVTDLQAYTATLAGATASRTRVRCAAAAGHALPGRHPPAGVRQQRPAAPAPHHPAARVEPWWDERHPRGRLVPGHRPRRPRAAAARAASRGLLRRRGRHRRCRARYAGGQRPHRHDGRAGRPDGRRAAGGVVAPHHPRGHPCGGSAPPEPCARRHDLRAGRGRRCRGAPGQWARVGVHHRQPLQQGCRARPGLRRRHLAGSPHPRGRRPRRRPGAGPRDGR